MPPLRPATAPHRLAEVPAAARAALVAGDPATTVTGITHDSRQVLPGDIYAALSGFTTHGAEFAAAARDAGAAAVLTDPAGLDRALAVGLPVLLADDARAAMGVLAAWAYGDPAASMLVVGVTGTNGKTTTTYLLESALRACGHRTGVIGTVGTRIDDDVVPTVRTTPESTDVHALLAVMRERGVTAVAMEVSSHALVLGRVDGLRFDVAVFTNLSQDHLDFHGDMESYFAAKGALFTPARSRRAVVGVDDDWGRRLAAASGVPVTTFSTRAGVAADWVVTATEPGVGGTDVRVRGPHGGVTLRSPLPGDFNVANTLAAFVALVDAGQPGAEVARGLADAPGVPGRLERVVDPAGRIDAFVDYAHTPDAVERVLAATRAVLPGGRLVAVLGCGGDRDRDKRALMGAVAARLADVVVVTDDNPRSEDPESIRATVLAGARAEPAARAQVLDVGDRRTAVARAVELAGAGDVVLVLGKGHETGQEIAGVVHPFDDRVALAEALAARTGGTR